MAWDEDDKNQKKAGPWGSRDPNKGPKSQSPWEDNKPTPEDVPDLDELLRQAQDRFGTLFGVGGGGGTGRRPGASAGDGKKGLWLIFLVIFALWLSTGFYRVLPEENAVLLTFGKYTSTKGDAGLGYHIPWPVQSVMKVNVSFDRRVEIGFRDQPPSRIGGDKTSDSNNVPLESQMLTGDENIVDIDFVVMWRIADAKNYLFQIRDPENTVKKVAESAMREIIGRSEIQKALTEGRADIETHTKELMQKMLDDYQSGITINSVQLLRVDPPSSVVDAFDDVQRARADKERTKNEAETYRNDIIPRARGDAQKLVQDGQAYKEAVISKAKGEAGRFQSVYEAYAQSKDVTMKRMYIETMEQVMQNSKKVIVGEGKNGQVLPYMSLDQLQAKAK